jgi:hypothetical protein
MQTTRLFGGAARTLAMLGTASTLLAASACDSFIEPDPQDILAPENFYRTSTDAIAAVNAVYEQNKWTHWLAYWFITDVATDDMIATANFGSDGHRLSNYTTDATEWVFGDVWGNSYRTINRANAVIGRVPAITMDETLKDRVLGEARFLRALSYFDLVRWFGDVPLIEQEVTSLQNLNVSRSPAAEVYALIESDLQMAVGMLPPSYEGADVGRVTSGAAQSLLAKVYLTQQKWDEAAAAAGAVINSGRYDLLDDWYDNFEIANELTNAESIFEVNYDGVSDPGAGSVHMLFALPQNFPGGDAYGLMQLPPSLLAIYSASDERGEGATYMLPGYTDAMGRTTTWAMPPGAAIHKFLDETSTQNMTARAWGAQRNNWIVLRYADVLLMYAEAVAEGGAPTAGTALSRLDEVRARAGLGPAGALAGQALIDAIRLERRREFVFEGQRWFDLSRWDLLDAAITAKTTELQTVYPGETDVHGVPSNLWPIPQSELDINPNLTQNPGWE